MMCIRDKLLRKQKKNSNNQTFKDPYKKFRNRVSNSLREVKLTIHTVIFIKTMVT